MWEGAGQSTTGQSVDFALAEKSLMGFKQGVVEGDCRWMGVEAVRWLGVAVLQKNQEGKRDLGVKQENHRQLSPPPPFSFYFSFLSLISHLSLTGTDESYGE